MSRPYDPTCIFCRIIAGEVDRDNVFWEDNIAIGVMDHQPLKPGHALLIPKGHYVTIKDLPTHLVGPFFERAATLARAVEIAFASDGSFSGYNTHVSQSVDHFHLHVVPRTFGDQLFAGGRRVRQPIRNIGEHHKRRDRLGETMRTLLHDRNST